MPVFKKIINIFRLHPDYENRVFGLDLMRALAIIFVVMSHALMLEKADTNFPWIHLVNGVELFFVLSGFLIGGILIKIFQKSENFGLKTIANFWVRRWFRTLPNYYLILILNIVFVYFGIINEDFSQFNWKFFLFLQNFSGPFTGFFWESWSLSIEEWFYLIFPILLGLLWLIFKKTQINKKLIFLGALLVLLFVPVMLRYYTASKIEVDAFWLDVKIFKVVIYRLDSIALGLLAAFIKHWYPKSWHKSRNILFILGIALSYTILYTPWPPNELRTKVIQIILQSIGCALLLPKFDSMKKAPKIITKIFTHVSLISYSMYLLNLAIIAEVMAKWLPIHNAVESWIAYVVYWIAVILGSTLLYKYFEKPMMDLRDRWNK